MDEADPKDCNLIPSYLEYIGRIAEVAIESGCPGLNDICLFYQERLCGLSNGNVEIGDVEFSALKAWPELIKDFIDSSLQLQKGNALVNHLKLPCWKSRLSDMDAEVLKTMLSMSAGDTSFSSGEQNGDGKDKAEAATTINMAGDELPAEVKELVNLLLSGLSDLQSLLQTAVEKALDPDTKLEDRVRAFETCTQQLDKYSEAADSIGFKGLAQVCSHMHENINLLFDKQLSTEISNLLTDWISSVSNYLSVVTDPEAAANLAVSLVNTAWPKPLTGDAAESLSMLLVTPEIEVLERADKRQTQATAEDVSLELPDDVDQDLLEAMLQEMPKQTEEFSAAIQSLSVGGSLEDINVAQRVAHTLKGAGNTVGIRGIAIIAHQIEDILLALAKHETLPPEPLVVMMVEVADCLEAMSEALAGIGEAPDNALEVLQSILDWANQIDREGIPTDDKLPVVKAEKTKTSDLKKDGNVTEKTSTDKVPEQMLRIPVSLVDDLLRLEGEEIIFTGQVHERIKRITEQSKTMQDHYISVQKLGGKLEELIDVKDMSALLQQHHQDDNFDALEMDQYSELHTCTRWLIEAATDIHDMGQSVMSQLASLEELVVRQGRINRESQEVALRTRMVPVNTIFSRLQRSVRQTCKATKKKVNLNLEGGETLIVSDVLNDMVDPLMHILRNAIDHGIEDVAEREKAGKPLEGNITLEFHREGGNILVRAQDDGAGIDVDGIRQTAIECGLLTPGQEITEEELILMILRPNFSTRKETTHVSGRGIGMDAVNVRVIELGGLLELKSEKGKGCLIEMKLPVSMISIHALLVSAGREIIAIINRGIEQILHADDGELSQNGEGMIFKTAGETYPVRNLTEMLNIQDRRSSSRQSRPVILVRCKDGIYAVLVDSVIDSQDIVVKGFGQYIPKLHGITGVTILGDGSVKPVIDMPEFLTSPFERRVITDDFEVTGIYDLPVAVVVDDSLSARRSLTQLMQDSGYEVREARDGIEAIEILNGIKPVILLIDMEMPRMNGIELTAHVRSHESTADIPIIMITSRSTAKHREEAKKVGVNSHFTKPFGEDDLLEEIERLRAKNSR